MGALDFYNKVSGRDNKKTIAEGGVSREETLGKLQTGNEFTFIRSDTHTQEILHPPTGLGHGLGDGTHLSAQDGGSSRTRRSLDVFRPSSRSRTSSVSSTGRPEDEPSRSRRLSQRLHLSRDKPATSEYVPENMPEIAVVPAAADARVAPGGDKDAYERQWENRATMLATANDEQQRRRSYSQSSRVSENPPQLTVNVHDDDNGGVAPVAGNRADDIGKKIDTDIQKAIQLHESDNPGDLERSTALFEQLADPRGANNPLSQVLYGLALRHGWGCEVNQGRAISYLSTAASNAAKIETAALMRGAKKGGEAKGELVLAIYELANCFREGWGVAPDPVAAKQYYETAANLGDTDAMNEVALCYLHGHGCKKDKAAAARYYRLAEDNGNKTLGNSWIWKDKYNP